MLQRVKALLVKDEFGAFKQNSYISIPSTRYLFFTHNLVFTHNWDVSSKTFQCVVMPRTFQPNFLCLCCTCLECPSLEEILLFLHGLALMISFFFFYMLLNHHEEVALCVSFSHGCKCNYLLPFPCHIRCSAKLEGRVDSLLKVPAESTCPTCICWLKGNKHL